MAGTGNRLSFLLFFLIFMFILPVFVPGVWFMFRLWKSGVCLVNGRCNVP